MNNERQYHEFGTSFVFPLHLELQILIEQQQDRKKAKQQKKKLRKQAKALKKKQRAQKRAKNQRRKIQKQASMVASGLVESHSEREKV